MPPAPARLEPVERDGAARLVQWTPDDGVARLTPLALAVDAPGLPAPEGLLALSRVPLERPTVLAGGSRFSPGAAGKALVRFDDELPYAPAGGADLVASAHKENVESHVPGNAFILVDPSGPIPDDVELVALAHARSLLDNPYTFGKAVTTARTSIGPERLLYLPGCGLPHEIALLAYCGVDLFDDASAVLAARQGAYVTTEGALPAAAAKAAGLDGADDLVAHARRAVQAEVARVHAAIRAGKLRELVEIRTRATPELAGILRRLDLDHHEFFAQRAPLLRHAQLFATSKESLQRPEVERFRRRLDTRYRKPTSARVLVLLPCSATKPYSQSKTHRILQTALGRVRNPGVVHEVVLTSPLGVVPRELEMCYPAAQYDLPVTGHWDEDEKTMIREALTALVERSRYDAIVVHLDEVEMEIAAPVLGEFHYTCEGDPLSPASLDNLANVLNKLVEPMPRVGWKQRTLDDMSSLARFQFGEAGHVLVEGAEAKGKLPYMRLMDVETGKQLAMTTQDRGYLSLAAEGGRRLLETGKHRVEIEDFRPKGTIFAVGVKGADPDISPEDDVVLHHNGDFRGVGRALAPGAEMGRMKKGACVQVRHKEDA